MNLKQCNIPTNSPVLLLHERLDKKYSVTVNIGQCIGFYHYITRECLSYDGSGLCYRLKHAYLRRQIGDNAKANRVGRALALS